MIFGDDGIDDYFTTGRGKMTVRAKAHIEEMRGSRERIVVTEIPYQVNKATLIKDIAQLVRDRRLERVLTTDPGMGVVRHVDAGYDEFEGLDADGTPGYDPVSATGQIAGGANLVAFTTGRGSMFGSKPAPCIKLATNTEMFRYLEEDMDINCGEIVDGTKTMEEMGQAIFQLFLDTASGKKTKSELLGLGDNEFVPWDIGITG